jgi:hypothetical protein
VALSDHRPRALHHLAQALHKLKSRDD